MADVLVVGGGMLGLLTARALGQRGAQVAVLDAAAQRPSASWAGGGILSALFPWRYPDGISRLSLPALQAYRRLAEDIQTAGGIDPQVRIPGMRVYGENDIPRALAWAARHGVDIEQQGGELWLPGVGTVRNPRMLKGVRHLLQVEGVDVQTELVSAILPGKDGWEIHAASGILRAKKVVVCAGYWTATLLERFRIPLNVRPVKGQMLLFRTQEKVPEEIRLTPEGYLIPRNAHTLLAGSTAEPDIVDQRPDEQAYKQLCAMAGRLWSVLEGKVPAAQWSGIRPGTSRELPVLAEMPGAPGLFIGTGHFRNGLVCAPESAELLADLVTGRPPRLAPEPYSISPSSSSPP